jgi:tripartite-type tricarboxylate transporter receptor subunit TctC
MPADVRGKIIKAVHDVMHDPQVAKRFGDSAFDIVNGSPEDFAARVRKDSDVMADLVARRIVTAD